MSQAPALPTGLRVLVVEDEMLVSLAIEDLLTDNDCVIVGPYARIAAAMAAARAESFDFALLDVNLNGEKGYPVAQIVADRGIPFLLLSGYGKTAIPPDRPDWLVCAKPFLPHELLGMMAARIGR